MATVLKYRFAMRRRTSTEWMSVNEVLLNSEWGYETNTGKLKIGNGVDTWTNRPYLNTSNIPETSDALYFSGLRVNQALAAGDGILISYASGVSTISLGGLPVYLTDESGNQLTDENGNFLIDTAMVGLPIPFASITSTPTTLIGYGITDAQKIGSPVVFPTYTLGTLPAASANQWKAIVVTDLTGGAEPCLSDGTNWRRFSDRSIAS